MHDAARLLVDLANTEDCKSDGEGQNDGEKQGEKDDVDGGRRTREEEFSVPTEEVEQRLSYSEDEENDARHDHVERPYRIAPACGVGGHVQTIGRKANKRRPLPGS